MDFDTAQRIAIEVMHTSYPNGVLPAWVSECVTVGGMQDEAGTWTVYFTVNPLTELKENEFWEERNGKRVLAKIDPATGQKRIVIHRRSEAITLFQVEIDPDDGRAVITFDGNLCDINGDLFERVT